jgi:hypothetical protein
MKTFFAGLGDFFKGLGSTLVALANSRKAVLTFVGVAVAAAGAFLPQYAEKLSTVAPAVDALLTVLVAAIAFEDAFKKPPAGGAG